MCLSLEGNFDRKTEIKFELKKVIVAHGLSCSEACGILPDQGSNPCLLRWQVDSSYPLDHQKVPSLDLLIEIYLNFRILIQMCFLFK